MKEKNKKSELCVLLLSIIFAVFFITVNSMDSFIYKFNVNPDQQCFITSARCMLRGDVIFRDVYEHRGTMNHFIYCIGLLISRTSFKGIYLLEILFFSVFLFYSAKTAKIFVRKGVISFLVMLLTGLFSSSLHFFYGGGESEEFILPFLAIPIYIFVRHFNESSGKRLTFREMASVGACFAVVFWIKYTLTGMYIGVFAAIIITGIKNKHKKDIIQYVLYFCAGALAASLPVMIYHAVTHSFYDMVYVYFYSVIFKYSSSLEVSVLSNIISILIPFAFIVFIILFASGKRFTAELKLFLLLMIIGETAGIVCGIKWMYSFEPLFAFFPIFVSGLWIIIEEKLLTNPDLPEKYKKTIDGFKAEYSCARKKTDAVFCTLSVLTVCISTFLISFTFGYTKYELSDYPQYKISRYIKEHSESSSPVLINYDCLEQGVYWLTGLYPPEKYYCSYNMESEEINSVYDEYINGKKADYIFCIGFYAEQAAPEGYTTVMFEKLPDNPMVGSNIGYQLMKRDDYGK